MKKIIHQIDLIFGSIWLGLLVALSWSYGINMLLGSYSDTLAMITDNAILSVIFLTWFFIGAHKSLLLLSWQKKDFFLVELTTITKIIVFMPILTLIPFKPQWYKPPYK